MHYGLMTSGIDVMGASANTEHCVDRFGFPMDAIIRSTDDGITITAKNNETQVTVKLNLREVEQLHLHCVSSHKRRMELERLRKENENESTKRTTSNERTQQPLE